MSAGRWLRRHDYEASDGFKGRWLRRHVEMGSKVCDVLTRSWLRRHHSEVSDGFTGSWLRRHVERCSVVSEVSDGSTGRRFCPRLRGNLRAVLFLFFPSSLALVNGCTLWPQPGALGSVVTVAAATGPMTGMNTLTNSPSEPHLKAFRVDLRCSGKSMKSELCSAEREHWLKSITVQRALRVRRQRHACNQRKVAPEIRVGVFNVQGMSCTKRSYRGMLWHIVMKMREQNADVMFLSDLSTPAWMSEGDKVVMLGLEEYTLFVNGMVGVVLSRCFVNLWQNSGSVTRTAGNKRWIGLTVRIGVFRYHLLSHYMPTQSGGSAHGPRHEHLEHGTELLSKLKRSRDYVILGGDANSHLVQMRD